MARHCEKKIKRLYTSFLKKNALPKDFWKLWCKNKKTPREREEIALGAILTQRTNWKNVEAALNNLKREKRPLINMVYEIGGKNIEWLEKLIRPSGFYKQKAERIFAFSKFIIENYGSLGSFFRQDAMSCRKQLLEISGIGQETADSILLYAGDKMVFVIDEYTRRLVKTKKISNDLSYNGLQKLFEQSLPKNVKIYQDFHALIVSEGKKINAGRKTSSCRQSVLP